MKIPQKAPDSLELLKKHSEEISKLIENPEIQKKIAEYNSRYLHWEEIRRREIDNAEVIWALTKMIRNSQQKKFKFNNWKFNIFIFSIYCIF